MVHLINGKTFMAPLLLNPIVTLLVLLPLAIIVLRRDRNKQGNHQWGVAIFFVYIYGLLSVTMFPISIFGIHHAVYSEGFGQLQMFSMDPANVVYYLPKHIIGSFILLMPLAFLSALSYPRWAKLRTNLLLCFGVSLIIECLQAVMNFFYLGNRVFDISDLVLNTAGAFIDWGCYKLFNKLFLRTAK